MKPAVISIMGPTASGKTALAIELASHLPVDIISVDSVMVYRGFDIGSSKPPKTVLEKYPHALVDVNNPNDVYDAGQFCKDAKSLIESSLANGRFPVLVGGTMMYFNALQNGLNDLPKADIAIREDLAKLEQSHGIVYLHQCLEKIDAQSAARIKPTDSQRVQRALEVYYSTGKPLSDFFVSKDKPFTYPHFNFAIMPTQEQRKILHQMIESRFSEMLEEGLVRELESILSKGDLDLELPALRSVGYRQVAQYLDDHCDFETMRFKAVVATRQLAKRQITWLRSWQHKIELEFLAKNSLDVVLDNIKRRC